MLSSGLGISPTITDMHNQTFYRFDGTDQHITAHADTLSALQARVNDTTFEFSISVWVKIDSVSGSIFIFKFSESNDDNLIQLFYHNNDAELRFAVKLAGGSAKVAKSGDNSGYEAGQDNDGWIHIAGRFGYSTDKVVLWVNGALVNASENNTSQTATADATFDTLEIMGHSGGSYWDGDVDQLAVYGRVLSDADIRTIYTAGVGGLDLTSSTHVDNSNLIMYHRFEEKSGTVCINEAGTDSTYVNAPTVVEHNGAFS